jgi:hypothetical protein
MVSGLGLAFIGVAVAIGAWLAPPDTLDYGVRFGLIAFAILCFFVGVILLIGPCIPHVRAVLCSIRIRLRSLLKGESNQATNITTTTSDETENDRFNNERIGPLKIEFANDGRFKHIGSHEGHGLLRAGHLQIYRVAVHNATLSDILGVQVWLSDIQPMPSELRGQGSLPLHMTHEVPGVNVVTLTKDEKRFVDVVSYFDNFLNPNICIEHTSSAAKKEIYKGDEGYAIELMAKGDNVRPFKRRFEIGVNNKELYMRSLDQPEQEAFEESFENESRQL